MNSVSPLQKILYFLIIAIVAIIAITTVILFNTHHARPGYGLRSGDPQPQTVSALNISSVPQAAYTDLGQLRIATKASKNKDTAVTIVIVPWLAYPDNDRTFYEELDQKNRSIRALITQYFSKYTQRELLLKGEQNIKDELLNEINNTLILGKINAIYFNEYNFIE